MMTLERNAVVAADVVATVNFFEWNLSFLFVELSTLVRVSFYSTKNNLFTSWVSTTRTLKQTL